MSRAARVATVVGLVGGALPLSSPASATACTVPSMTYPTIQSAIADVSCDPIMVAAGTYNEDLDIDRNITMTGAGANVTTVDGSGTGSVIDIVNDTPDTVTITGVTVTGGGMDAGAGIDIDGVTVDTAHVVTLGQVLVTGNTATGNGGGISVGNTVTLTMSNSAVTNNASGNFGGGIGASQPTLLKLVNVTISGNTAAGGTGGVGAVGPMDLSNVTIVNNTADSNSDGLGDGGGLRVQTPTGSATIRNTLIANNVDASPGAEDPDCEGPITTAGYNVIEAVSAGCGFVAGTGDLTGMDPLVGALGSNGGPTPTHPLLSGSLAIDAGNPAGCSDGVNPLATDQRGEPRAVDGNEDGMVRCDIGAFELQPPKDPKDLALKAKPKRVEQGKRTRLIATITPCNADTQGDLVQFRKGSKVLAEKASDSSCMARKRVKVRRKTSFRAFSPEDDDSLAATSKKVTVKVLQA